MEKVEELYSLLVPLYKNRLIVPRSCVAEVIRFTLGDEITDHAPWFRGFMQWNNQRVPMICFEELCGLPSSEPGGRTRVAVFQTMSGTLEAGYFGILTEGFPQLVRVNRDVMQRDDQQAWPKDGPVICQIKMINEYPLIPDLQVVETLISDHLQSAGSTLA
jgi:chemosensory pili system protein ChpC